MLDPFQLEALDALDRGESVLVSAPTGSGKTVVAEYAVHRALAAGRRAFYTTPIKALSNQKYLELVARHGPGQVGLLTGDNAVRGEAPVVVMTTEVLRNMIYAGSEALDDLDVVVLDEVHFLQDTYRGPVWEEVIVHLPPEVRLVALSATVSNATEVAAWIQTVRGPTACVLADHRPVPLQDLWMVGDRTAERLWLLPMLVDGRPNPAASRLESDAARRVGARGRPRRRLYTPRRVEVVEHLHDLDLLPAIVFVFSRNGCDDAVAACLAAGLRLTTAAERRRIRAIVEDHLGELAPEDLGVLGYARLVAGLEAGVAAHHAGMVPPFKETVEACFTEGLVKAVFATETLALGINMPARTVVIEKLTKFTGEHHEFLKPGDYTQLTGRAGRRGIDEVGHAVVLWSPFVAFEQVAALAASRSYPLASAFRPTANMAANLVRRWSPEQARHLLSLSFGQFQADRDVVRLRARLERRRAALAEARAEATCERGDLDAYRRSLPASVPPRRGLSRGEVEAALARLRPGDVVRLPPEGGEAGPAPAAVVLTVASRGRGATRVRTLTAAREVVTLGATDVPGPLDVVARVDLPEPYEPRSVVFQREVARRLRRAVPAPARSTSGPGGSTRERRAPEPQGRAAQAQAAAGGDGVASCPDLARHLRAAAQADRIAAEVASLERAVGGRRGVLARQFDDLLALLASRGFVDGWALTPAGERLARLYHECDLLLAEAVEAGLLDGLEPAALAGLVSCFTYEHRSPEPSPPPWFPSGALRRRWGAIEGLAEALRRDEERLGLPRTRPPDAGFFGLAHAWASGQDLTEVLADEDLSAGDFVRNVKQLVDLLGQLAEVAPVAATARAARTAADRLRRGVVSLSGAVGAADDEPDEPEDPVGPTGSGRPEEPHDVGLRGEPDEPDGAPPP